MKLTKLEHACFIVENDNESIIIDPGNLTTDFVVPNNLKAIIITHNHPDHLDIIKIKKCLLEYTDVLIFTTQDTRDAKLNEYKNINIVTHGNEYTVGSFNLEFFGKNHEKIYDTQPVIQNIGILINKNIFYPGDSFTNPGVDIPVLALPIAAPWLKIADTLDYLQIINPTLAFPTHDGILNEAGKNIIDNWCLSVASANDINYSRIDELII